MSNPARKVDPVITEKNKMYPLDHIDYMKLESVTGTTAIIDVSDHWYQLAQHIDIALIHVISKASESLNHRETFHAALLVEMVHPDRIAEATRAIIISHRERGSLKDYASEYTDIDKSASDSAILVAAASRMIKDNLDYLHDLYKSSAK